MSLSSESPGRIESSSGGTDSQALSPASTSFSCTIWVDESGHERCENGTAYEKSKGEGHENVREHEKSGDENQENPEAYDLQDQVRLLEDEIQALKAQTAELEHDRDTERDLKLCFKTQACRLGESLKSCREVALNQGVDLRGIGGEEAVDNSAPQKAVNSQPPLADGGSLPSTPALKALKSQAKECGWLISPNDIEMGDRIGRGSTADIYKGVWHGLPVAVKCLKPSCFGEYNEGIDTFCREVEVLSEQRHPYILQLLATCLSPPDHAWIITEFMPSGTLMEWLHGNKKREWSRIVPLPPFKERIRVATEISIGMQYLHERQPKVMHRDLKPSNIFLNKHHEVRIADFSFSRYINSKRDVLTGETGTFLYMAPEVMRHECYDEKCDVFSFGVMLCEIVTGSPPYIDTYLTPVQIAVAVAEGSLRPTIPGDVHPKLKHLISRSWSQESSKRPSFAEITAALTSCSEELITVVNNEDLNPARHFINAGEQIHGFFSGLLGRKETAGTCN